MPTIHDVKTTLRFALTKYERGLILFEQFKAEVILCIELLEEISREETKSHEEIKVCDRSASTS